MHSPGDWQVEEGSSDPALGALFANAPASERQWTWDALDELLQSGGIEAIARLLDRPARIQVREQDLEDAILSMDFDE